MSTTGQSPVAGSHVPPNFAPIVTRQLIVSLLNFFFMGTLFIKSVHVYCVCFPKDSLFVRLLVYFIFFAMFICACVNAADVEYWFGFSFGDISCFTHARYSPFYTPIMGSFIAMLVQLFFCCRIFVIERSAWRASVCIGLISMLQAAGCIGAGTYYDLWLAGGATSDVLIAVAMTYLAQDINNVENRWRKDIDTETLTRRTTVIRMWRERDVGARD
ncbi:hypothetical protein C8R43DRAFT_1121228 [Mycena crocata]|nr:hypothetical protein C8R43DRAFT_1121228 [Mycena crocata]